MIQEISNFIKTVPEEALNYGLQLKLGLHIFISVENDPVVLSKEVFDKKTEMNALFHKALRLQVNSIPVSPAKIFNPNKKIFGASCSPFALSFKKGVLEKWRDKKELKKEFKLKEDLSDLEVNVKFKELITRELDQYFNAAAKYTNEKLQQSWCEKLEQFCKNTLIDFLDGLEAYQKLKPGEYITLYLEQPALENYREAHQKYLSEKVFNKDKFNVEFNETTFGISDSLSGFNDKKMFLQHWSAPMEYNYRIAGADARLVWQFFQMRKNKQLPNPMPVFIEANELTNLAVSTYQEDGRRGYAEIIKAVIDTSQDENVGNYYLIFFQGGLKGSSIIDLDFVSGFRYKMEDLKIREIFPMKGKLESETKVNHVFDFERKVLKIIFNNQMVQKRKDGSWGLNYFSELELNPKYGMTPNTFDKMMKYRKAFYDFIYKSKREAIQQKHFNDIMESGIFEDIQTDEIKNGYHSNKFKILNKLNIWFSLYEYFDFTQFSKPLNDTPMASKIEKYHAFTDELAAGKNHLQEGDDEQFAFTAGQVIAYLFSKSRSSDRSYSRLEPFLQKRDCGLFKQAILRFFEMYKHENFSNNFKKPFAEVMAFETETNLKDLSPLILAGFFSENKLFANSSTSN